MVKKSKTLLGIVISVTSLSSFLIGCGVDSSGGSITPQESSNSATLTWEAPTTNVDGTLLTDLAGYKVYYGTASGNYTETKDVSLDSCQDTNGETECSYTITNLNPGTYYFAVTAYDTAGNKSDYSNEVSKYIQ